MKMIFRWILSAAATVALITVFAEYSQKNRERLVNDVTASAAETVSLVSESSEAPTEDLEQGYILREYEGRLAVFKDDEAEPLYVFNVSMNTMSDYDKNALQEGIAAKDLTELKTLVEDYTS